MGKLYILSFSLFALFTVSFLPPQQDSKKADIYGYWVREDDGLQMELSHTEDNYDIGFSEIAVEGNKGFPCNLKKEIIYKNIVQEHDSVWTCDFLVITVNDCTYNYKTGGKMSLTKMGKLLVVCPGFQPMYYDKKNPRH
ncbi:MAG: hypothetical protein AAFN93_25660 [Bacteroidota bacterium]